jgi:hypothetical protein
MEREKRKPWYHGMEISNNIHMRIDNIGQLNQYIINVARNTGKCELNGRVENGLTLERKPITNLTVDTNIRSLEGLIFPPILTYFGFIRNPFITSLRNVNFAESLITHLNLSYCAISSIQGIVFPPRLIDLNLSYNEIQTLVGVVFPSTLIDLNLSYNEIQTLVGVVFPDNIEVINLQANYIVTLNGFVFPPRLVALYLAENYIVSLDNIIFPKYLNQLSLPENTIQSIRGTRFPKVLFNCNTMWGIPKQLIIDWVDPENKELSDRIQSLTEQTAVIPILQNRIETLLDHVGYLTNSLKILLQDKTTEKIDEFETLQQNRMSSSVIFVKLNNGRIVTIPYRDVKVIGDIIEYLKEHYFIALTFAKPVLSYNNIILDLERSLADYNIENESMLYLINRTFGGFHKKKSHVPKNRNNRKKSKIN